MSNANLPKLPFALNHRITIDGVLPVLESCHLVRALAYAVKDHGGDQIAFEAALYCAMNAHGDYRAANSRLEPQTADDWRQFTDLAMARAEAKGLDPEGLESILDQAAGLAMAWTGNLPGHAKLLPSEVAFLTADHEANVDLVHDAAMETAVQAILDQRSDPASVADPWPLVDATAAEAAPSPEIAVMDNGKQIDRKAAASLATRQGELYAKLEANPYDTAAQVELEELEADYVKVFGDEAAGTSLVLDQPDSPSEHFATSPEE